LSSADEVGRASLTVSPHGISGCPIRKTWELLSLISFLTSAKMNAAPGS
jgi:hypothetical protein